jgi:hypothetical protein
MTGKVYCGRAAFVEARPRLIGSASSRRALARARMARARFTSPRLAAARACRCSSSKRLLEIPTARLSHETTAPRRRPPTGGPET